MDSARIFGYRIELELDISRSPGTFDARQKQRRSNSQPPVFPGNADAEHGAMPHLVFRPYCLDSSSPYHCAINYSNNLDFIFTIFLLFQNPAFLCCIKSVFIGICK